MYKTRGGVGKEDEVLAAVAGLAPTGMQSVRLERAKPAALAMAIALLE